MCLLWAQLDMLSVQKAQHEAARRQAEDTAKEYCTETEGQEALQHMKDLYAEQLGEQATEEEIQQRLQADPLEEHLRIVVKEVHRSEHQAGGTLEELEVPWPPLAPTPHSNSPGGTRRI